MAIRLRLWVRIRRAAPGWTDDGPLPWAKIRQGQKLLRLGESYGPHRLDAACRKALSVDLIPRKASWAHPR